MAGFNTKYTNRNGEYEVQFFSTDYHQARFVENVCRALIGHLKPNEEPGIYISRTKALEFPFANGKYDKEHAEPAFIRGCESYREWLEQLPVVCLPCIEWHEASNDAPIKNGKYLVVYGETQSIATMSYAMNLESVDDWDFEHCNYPGWYIWEPEYGYNEVRNMVRWWAELPEKPKEREE